MKAIKWWLIFIVLRSNTCMLMDEGLCINSVMDINCSFVFVAW